MMVKALDFVCQNVLDMPAYEPMMSLELLSQKFDIENIVKLDANENPYGPLPEVKTALAALDKVQIYPDPECRRVRKLVADYHKMPEDHFIFGNGSDELIDLFMRAIIEPGDKVLNCPPTFGMYTFDGALNRAEIVSVPRREDFSLDIPGILQAAAEQKPKILFLANPNNPDGGVIPEVDLKQILDLPLLVVMDEAYIQFSDQGKSMINEVENRENLIVLRTFSKWAGLAGMRIGYGAFPRELVPVLMKAKQPYNVSVPAQVAAAVTMENVNKSDEIIEKIKKQREVFFKALKQFSWIKAIPSQTNFLLCRFEGFTGREIQQRLLEKGFLVRSYNKTGLEDSVRISVGSAEQVQALVSALKEIGESCVQQK
jgi:histidinol-phosphate aminotransferase